jgi:hypothetical protein
MIDKNVLKEAATRSRICPDINPSLLLNFLMLFKPDECGTFPHPPLHLLLTHRFTFPHPPLHLFLTHRFTFPHPPLHLLLTHPFTFPHPPLRRVSLPTHHIPVILFPPCCHHRNHATPHFISAFSLSRSTPACCKWSTPRPADTAAIPILQAATACRKCCSRTPQ